MMMTQTSMTAAGNHTVKILLFTWTPSRKKPSISCSLNYARIAMSPKTSALVSEKKISHKLFDIDIYNAISTVFYMAVKCNLYRI